MSEWVNTKRIFEDKLINKSKMAKKSNIKGQPEFVVFYDNKLLQVASFNNWLKQFNYSFPLAAGESLKDLKNFSQFASRMTNELDQLAHKDIVFVAVGGGSIGDAIGFLASIFKRGVRLIHMPTTWLAAIDSAHGGKTALNVDKFKNQLGSFYPAQSVIIVKSLLKNLDEENTQSAFSELIKIGIINTGSIIRKIDKAKVADEKLLWSLLPLAIQAKMKIVKQDPYEKKGHRQVLNLGHTFGHALESENKLSHGLAVAQGLYFSIQWSLEKKYLSKREAYNLAKVMDKVFSYKRDFSGLKIRNFNSERLKQILLKDKKRTDSESVNFIFIHRTGKVSKKSVTMNELVDEAHRQGWCL